MYWNSNSDEVCWDDSSRRPCHALVEWFQDEQGKWNPERREWEAGERKCDGHTASYGYGQWDGQDCLRSCYIWRYSADPADSKRELGLNTGKTKTVYWKGQYTGSQHQVQLVLRVMGIIWYIIIDLCPGPQNSMQFIQSFTSLTAPSRLLIRQHWDDEARALMAGRMATIFAQLGRSSTTHLFACIEIYYNLQSVLRISYNRAVSYICI